MKHSKILFLDFDGVLNSTQSRIWVQRRIDQGDSVTPIDKDFCPIALSNLKKILELIPDLKIVISSSWRLGKDLGYFQKLFTKLGINSDSVIGLTPIMDSNDYSRIDEIKAWLKRNPTKSFVVLDDFSFGTNAKNLIQVNDKIGLTLLDVKKISKVFKIKNQY